MSGAAIPLRGLLGQSARGRARAADEAVLTGLEFGSSPGALVAVCGLAGGCGTTTLAYLIARRAAHESAGSVLLCEVESPLAGLAALAGRASTDGLGGVADRIGDGGAPERLPSVWLTERLALLAGPQRPRPAVDDPPVRAVLERARERHALVVADCRTIDHALAPAVLSAATHVLWTLPAEQPALLGVEGAMRCGAVPTRGAAAEALVAIAVRPEPTATVRALRKVAEGRHDRLVLIPHAPSMRRVDEAADDEIALSALAQIATVLRRGAGARAASAMTGAG